MKYYFCNDWPFSIKIIRCALLILFYLILVSLECSAQTDAKKPVVRIGIYHNPPKIAIDQSGKPFGFWIDLLEDFLKREELNVSYIAGTWEECLLRLAQNQIDSLPDMALSPDRAQQYIFGNEVVYLSWSYLFIKDHSAFKGLEDLQGKTIAVLKGSINYLGPEGIRNILKENRISCNFLELSSYSDVLMAVSSDLAFAGVTSKDFGQKHSKEYGLYHTPMLFSPAKLYFAFAPSSSITPYLRERLDQYLRGLKAKPDSLYYQALAKWFGESAFTTKVVIPDWLILVSLFLLIIANLFLLYSLYVRKRFKFNQLELFAKKRELETATERINSLDSKFKTTFDSLIEGVI